VIFLVGEFPIRWDGQVHGRLTAREEGVHTVWQGECEDPGKLVRLWVFGEKTKGYLGVMEPAGGKLEIRRRFSPLAMAELPREILFAAPEGTDTPPGTKENGERETLSPKPAPTVTVPREKGTDLLWYELGDGSLYTLYDRQGYRAIPVSDGSPVSEKMVERRRINGRDYAVYALRDGRMIL